MAKHLKRTEKPSRQVMDWEALRINRGRFAHERLAALAELLADLDNALARAEPMQVAMLLLHLETAFAEIRGLLAAIRVICSPAEIADQTDASTPAETTPAPTA